VFLLRPWVRRLIGPRLAYRLWAIPVAALATGVIPSLPTLNATITSAASTLSKGVGLGTALIFWGLGAFATFCVFAWAELAFRRMERRGEAGPAVVGVWPRLVVPADYAVQFTADERRIIRIHERVHMRRRDTVTNLFVAAAGIVFWFNPLIHLGRHAMRLDQELSCDALALEDVNVGARAYGEVLLKAQLAAPRSWLACAWSGMTGHPLELRVRMLALRRHSVSREMIGAAAVVVLALVVAASVWSLTPPGVDSLRFNQDGFVESGN
jgi:beta-lactamase regulating signal transducer with metallopeptidase domain